MTDNITFEQSLSCLEKIVKALEGDQVSLEKSIELYKQAIQYKELCEKKLNEARHQIEQISINATGPSTTPMEFSNN